MAEVFNFSLNDQIITARPFKADLGGSPQEFNLSPYNTPLLRTTMNLFSPFYYQNPSTCNTTSFPNLLGSALYQVRLDPQSDGIDGDDQFGYFVMNGLAPANDSDPNLANNPNDFLAKFNLITMTYGFMMTGQSTHPVDGTSIQGSEYQRIRQLPRVEVVGPDPADVEALTNPATLKVKWRVTWRRWDGNLYTPAYTTNFYESTPLYYVPMYSADGVTWRYIVGDNDVVADWRSRSPLPKEDGGEYDPATDPSSKKHYLCQGAGTNECPGSIGAFVEQEIDWNVGSLNPSLDLGAGNDPPGKDYLIRVVVHRKEINNHFAYHDLKIRVRPE